MATWHLSSYISYLQALLSIVYLHILLTGSAFYCIVCSVSDITDI